MDKQKLIAQVFLNPSIWDKRLKSHSNRTVVDKCWQDISSEMRINEAALRKKWKYLRDQFCVEYGKIKSPNPGDNGGEAILEPKWPHFKSLLFLKDVVRPRASSGNISSKMDEFDEYNEMDSEGHVEDVNENSELSDDAKCSLAELTQVTINSPDNMALKRRHYENSTYNQTIIERERKKAKILSDSLKDLVQENEDLLFFRTLLPHVMKIPPHLKLRFRSRIQQVVDEFAYPEHASYQLDNVSPSDACQTILTYVPSNYDSSSSDRTTPTINVVPVDKLQKKKYK